MTEAERDAVRTAARNIEWREHVERLAREALRADRWRPLGTSEEKDVSQTLGIIINQMPLDELRLLAKHIHDRVSAQLDAMPIPASPNTAAADEGGPS